MHVDINLPLQSPCPVRHHRYRHSPGLLLICIFAILLCSPVNAVTNHTSSKTSSEHQANERRIRSVREDTDLFIRCYGLVYGCFSIARPWISSARPINLFPESPEITTPNFFLYTRQNPNQYFTLRSGDVLALRKSAFKPKSKVLFVTHGYLENGHKKWIKDIVQEALRVADLNVIVVDWAGGSGPPYTQAVANIRLIGVIVAHFIMFLQKEGKIRTESCHIVGHSLGAHLAGYAGTRLKEFGFNLGRITGLDPAEPYFENTEPMIRLDPSDALFVDVIHTDAGSILSGGLGLMQPSGHLDFYPNGGIRQPGCGINVRESIEKEDGSLVYGIRRFLGCNHLRAYEIFAETFSSQCPFLAVQCSSWEDFVLGQCGDCGSNRTKCFMMGYRAEESWRLQLPVSSSAVDLISVSETEPIQAYLITGSESPYCRYHYRIDVVLSDTTASINHGSNRGKLAIQIKTQNDTTDLTFLNSEARMLEPGRSYSFVLAAPWLGQIESLFLEWQYASSIFNPLTWRLLESPLLYVNHIQITNLETGLQQIICGYDEPLESTAGQWLRPDVKCRLQETPPEGDAAILAGSAGAHLNVTKSDSSVGAAGVLSTEFTTKGNGNGIRRRSGSKLPWRGLSSPFSWFG